MLTKLALQNFKAWERCAIDLGRITVLIGPNGSGKSSLLQALGLLKQSRNQESLVWNGPYESLGRFEDVVSHGATRRQVEFQLSLKTEEILGDSSFECRYRYGIDNFGPVDHTTEYKFPKGESIVINYNFLKSQGTIDTFPQGSFELMRMSSEGAVAVPFRGQAYRPNPSSSGGGYNFRDAVLRQLTNTFIIKTKRAVDLASYPNKPAGYEFTESGDVVNFIAYNDDSRQELSNWLSRVFGEDIQLSTKFIPDYRVSLEVHRGREVTNVAHEGAGMQNIIWPLSQISASPPHALIALEEPEIHIHPKAQAQLGTILADIAQPGDKQILITTQSEHILMSFLTEAVKSGASPDDFRVYYCTSHNRVAEIEELRLDPDGGLDGGLKGFFEAGFDETQRYLEALTARNSG